MDKHSAITIGLSLASKDLEENYNRSEQPYAADRGDDLSGVKSTIRHNAHHEEEQEQKEVGICQCISLSARAAFHGPPHLLYPCNDEPDHMSRMTNKDEASLSTLQRSPFSENLAIVKAASHASGNSSLFDGCMVADDELCGLFGTVRCGADAPFPCLVFMLHQRCASENRPYLKMLTHGSANTNITEMDLNGNGNPSFDVASWKEQIVAFRAFKESLFGEKHDWKEQIVAFRALTARIDMDFFDIPASSSTINSSCPWYNF